MNTIYLLEVIEGLGITIRPIKTIIQANEESMGKVIDNKCYGYTEEQCLKAFDDYCQSKITENNKIHMEENEKYLNIQRQVHDVLWRAKDKNNNIQCEVN